MKQTSYLALAILCLVLIGLTSCKKSSNSNSSEPASGNSMSATMTVNNSFSSTNMMGEHSISDGVVYLLGFKIASGDTTALVLVIADTATVGGTDTLGMWGGMGYGSFQFANFLSTGSMPWQSEVPGGPGNLTLTSWDTTKHIIAGNFSGTLYQYNNGLTDSLVLTNGKFNASYTNVP